MNQHHPGFSYSLAESRQFDSLVSKIVTATEFAFPSQEFMEDSKALGRETNPPFGGDHARTGTEPHRRGGQADESVRFGGFRKAGRRRKTWYEWNAVAWNEWNHHVPIYLFCLVST